MRDGWRFPLNRLCDENAESRQVRSPANRESSTFFGLTNSTCFGLCEVHIPEVAQRYLFRKKPRMDANKHEFTREN
jgi:hypothetical protein